MINVNKCLKIEKMLMLKKDVWRKDDYKDGLLTLTKQSQWSKDSVIYSKTKVYNPG